MYKTCLECAEKLLGRSDKKFCSDSCRNTFNNRINREKNRVFLKTNNRLRRNYRLLQKLLARQDHAHVSREHLLDLGFDFKSVTRIHITPKGLRIHFLYDIGYYPKDGSNIRLIGPVKNQKKESEAVVAICSYGNSV